MRLNIAPEEFWASVDRKAGTCWEWRKSRTWNGYGRLTINRREYRAHRLAYELSKGPVPEGLCIMHACDNRLCCNPAHLTAGTSQENNADKVAKGRQPRGSDIVCSKLTEEDVRFIRQAKVLGLSYRRIGKLLAIEAETARRVAMGRMWGHVEGDETQSFNERMADLSERLAARERIAAMLLTLDAEALKQVEARLTTNAKGARRG